MKRACQCRLSHQRRSKNVIPAKAGIQQALWIPAFAGMTESTRLTGALALAFLFLIAPWVASAQKTGSGEAVQALEEQETERDSCSNHRVRLEGAAAGGGAAVSFREEWASDIERAVACVRETPGNLCVRVQGRYDDMTFPEDVIAVYGSQEAAQRARAEARAAMVVAKLLEFGLRADAIEQLPAPAQPSFRGVQLVLVPDCQSNTAQGNGSAVVDTDALADAVAAKLQAGTDSTSTTVSNWVWFDAGVDALYTWRDTASESSALAALGRIGVGWHNPFMYARAYGGLGGGGPDTQRVVFELGGAVGYYHAPWLQLGVAGFWRQAAPAIGDPWLVETWGIGIEGHQCIEVASSGELCIREMLAPLGTAQRQGELDRDGQIERIPEVTNVALSFAVGVAFRHTL